MVVYHGSIMLYAMATYDLWFMYKISAIPLNIQPQKNAHQQESKNNNFPWVACTAIRPTKNHKKDQRQTPIRTLGATKDTPKTNKKTNKPNNQKKTNQTPPPKKKRSKKKTHQNRIAAIFFQSVLSLNPANFKLEAQIQLSRGFSRCRCRCGSSLDQAPKRSMTPIMAEFLQLIILFLWMVEFSRKDGHTKNISAPCRFSCLRSFWCCSFPSRSHICPGRMRSNNHWMQCFQNSTKNPRITSKPRWRCIHRVGIFTY